MKPILHKLTVLAAITLSASILFFSCKKDRSSSKLNDKAITDPSVPMSAALAKKYYHNLRIEQGDVVTSTNASVSAGRPRNRKYLLMKAAYISQTSTHTFAEIPLYYNQKLTTVIKQEGERANLNSDLPIIKGNVLRVIIYKEKATGQVNQRIVTYIPDLSYLIRHKFDISHNHIDKLDKDFFGYIKYQDWSGKTIFLLRIEEGKSVKRYFSSYNNVKGKRGGTTSAEVCEDVVDISWIETCYYADPEGLTEICTNSEPTYEYHTICYDDGTGDPECFDTGGCYDPDNDPEHPPVDNTVGTNADHQLPNKQKLPPKSTSDTQFGAMCTFKTMEWMSKYFNGNLTAGNMALWYAQSQGMSMTAFLATMTSNGVPSNNLNGLITHFFNGSGCLDIPTSINAGHPVMGTLDLGGGNGHEVFVTGYNNNGSIEYFDPEQGTYNTVPANQIIYPYEITSQK